MRRKKNPKRKAEQAEQEGGNQGSANAVRGGTIRGIPHGWLAGLRCLHSAWHRQGTVVRATGSEENLGASNSGGGGGGEGHHQPGKINSERHSSATTDHYTVEPPQSPYWHFPAICHHATLLNSDSTTGIFPRRTFEWTQILSMANKHWAWTVEGKKIEVTHPMHFVIETFRNFKLVQNNIQTL